VGSAQSGAQIAEELYESRRKVFIATGRAGRTPRRYRGKDANWWFAKMGHYERKVSELGRLEGVENGIVRLSGDLYDNLAAADRAEAEFIRAVDTYIAATAISVSEETLPVLRDGFHQEILTELDLSAAGITNVIWATGYSFDFSLVRLPVTDSDCFPIQTRGVTAYPGLFFVGLPWLYTAKSGLIYGLGEDARFIADRIIERGSAAEHEHAPALVPLRSARRSQSDHAQRHG
jgi:putative flavoprotein involved in K+ transport